MLWAIGAMLCGCNTPPPRYPSAQEAALTMSNPVGLCFIPEMDFIPEVEGWKPCESEDYKTDLAFALKDWDSKRYWVSTRITPGVVRSISRWAKPQMEHFNLWPPVPQTRLEVVGIDGDGRKLLLEGDVGVLPTHNPLVTRRLLLYLLYDRDNKQVFRVTVTIRGDVQEQ
jgi:hypothetical protein